MSSSNPILQHDILNLKQQYLQQTSETLFAQRPLCFASEFRENRREPEQIRFAKGLAAFLDLKEIYLTPDDILAGFSQAYDYTLPPREEGQPDWTMIFHSDQEVETQWKELHRYFEEPEEQRRIADLEAGYRCGLFHSYTGGHVIAGYANVLKLGFTGLCAEAERALQQDRDNVTAQAALIVQEAAIRYTRRYARKAQALADQTQKPELTRIAEACARLAEHPPSTFFEAVQLLWLTHEILICEQRAVSLSLGRLDQYLFPFYQADVSAGRLTDDEAETLIQALWLKFGRMRWSYQNVTLGGMSLDGEDESNPISLMCLRASRILRMDQPLITARWHPNITNEYWDEVQKLIEAGLGFPALFNDVVAMRAKEPLAGSKDAANYGIVGCVEISIPAKEFALTELLRINWAKLLELMLNRGRCPITGEVAPLVNPNNIDVVKSFPEFLAWYKRELAHAVDWGIEAVNLIDRDIFHQRPYPFLSSSMDGCVARGKDVTAGGAVYNLSSVNGCGMADTADSLAALKRYVFEQEAVSLPEFAEILRHNFTDSPELLARIRKQSPKYGNDDDGADALMADLADEFCRNIASHTNPRGGNFQAGLYTVDNQAKLGKLTGALPNGRLEKVSLANAISPCQGADVNGPTAVFNSSTKINHGQCGNGMVLDMKFHPTFFAEKSRQDLFRGMIEAYFEAGGMEVQFNVIDKDTLLRAQTSPDDYRDLIVRVSGFSAYFVDLDSVLQDEIIARTDQAEFM